MNLFITLQTAVKSCKQVNKNLSDMGKELEVIGQFTSVGDLPEKLAHAEEAKVEVEGQLLQRNALLQEMSEEWEQCEKKLKESKSWLEKARQHLESGQNKKKPLRDQHAIREKMLSDITIQKTKISMSVEKLQVHFKSGIGGDNKISDTADALITELNNLNDIVKEQALTLEKCLTQIDQYQQEIQQLRHQIVQVEQQLRSALSPTYLPNDREKAMQEQQALQTRIDNWRHQSRQLLDEIHTIDPYYVQPSDQMTMKYTGVVSYAAIAAGHSNPASRGTSPFRSQSHTPPPTTPQLHRPIGIRPQQVPKKLPKSPKEQVDKQKKINNQQSTGRKGRSPNRKSKSKKSTHESSPQIQITTDVDTLTHDDNKKQSDLATKLNVKDSTRRSPSPIWNPGSTSYAEILRNRAQAQLSEVDIEKEPRDIINIPSEYEQKHYEQEIQEQQQQQQHVEIVDAPQVMRTQEAVNFQRMEIPYQGMQAQVQLSQQQPSFIKETWSDVPIENYQLAPQPDMYTFMPQIPELVGFINTNMRTMAYPVGSFVYPQGHQPVTQLDVAMNPYDGHMGYSNDHYVPQQAYMPSDIYQQAAMQQQQCPPSGIIYQPVMSHMPEMSQQQIPNQNIQHLQEVIEPVQVINKPIVEEEKVIVEKQHVVVEEIKNIEEDKEEESQDNQGSSISYAKILSQGLAVPTTPSPPSELTTDRSRRSHSPHEVTPPQAKLDRSEMTSITESEVMKKSKDNDWDIIKKKDSKKKNQDDKGKRNEQTGKDNKKLKNKNEKSNENNKIVKDNIDEKNLTQVVDKKEKKLQDKKNDNEIIEIVDEQKNKKKQKKNKNNNKNQDDDIDKALKEIEELEKQKNKVKGKENKQVDKNNKEIIGEIPKIDNKISKKQNKEKVEVVKKESIDDKSKKSAEKIIEKIIEVPKVQETIKAETKPEQKSKKQKKNKQVVEQIVDKSIEIKIDETKELKETNKIISIEKQTEDLTDNSTKSKNNSKSKKQIKEKIVEQVIEKPIEKSNEIDKTTAPIEEPKTLIDKKENKDNVQMKNDEPKKDAKQNKKSKKQAKDKIVIEKEKIVDENVAKKPDVEQPSEVKKIVDEKIEKSIEQSIEKLPQKIEETTAVSVDESKKSDVKKQPTKGNKKGKEKIIDSPVIKSQVDVPIDVVKLDLKEKDNIEQEIKISVVEKSAEISQVSDGKQKSKKQNKKNPIEQGVVKSIEPDTKEPIKIIESLSKQLPTKTVEKSDSKQMPKQKAEEKEKITVEQIKKSAVIQEPQKSNSQQVSKSKKENKEKLIEKIETEKPKEISAEEIKKLDTKEKSQEKIQKKEDKPVEDLSTKKSVKVPVQDNKKLATEEKQKSKKQQKDKANVQQQSEKTIEKTAEKIEADIKTLALETIPNAPKKLDKSDKKETPKLIEESDKKSEKSVGKIAIEVPAKTIVKEDKISENKSTDKPIAEIPIEKIVKSEVKPAEQPDEPKKLVEKIIEKPVEKITETPIEKITEKPAEKIIEKPADKPVPMLQKAKSFIRSQNQSPEKIIVEKIAPTYVVETMEVKPKENSPKRTIAKAKTLAKIDLTPTKSCSSNDNAKIIEAKKIDDKKQNELAKKCIKDDIQKPHSSMLINCPPGKAVIIEKKITTVTTTRSGTDEISPPAVKSTTSVEILENVTLPKTTKDELVALRPANVEASLTTTYAMIGTEPVDISIAQSSLQINEKNLNQVVENESKVKPMSIDKTASKETGQAIISSSPEMIVEGGDNAPLFGSVQDRKKTRVTKTDNLSVINVSQVKEPEKKEKVVSVEDEAMMKAMADKMKKKKKRPALPLSDDFFVTEPKKISKECVDVKLPVQQVEDKKISASVETKSPSEEIIIKESEKITEECAELLNETKKLIEDKVEIKNTIKNKGDVENKIEEKLEGKDEGLQAVSEDLVRPYYLDYHQYSEAENQFHENFKVVQVLEEPRAPPQSEPRPRSSSIGRIIQESKMKPKEIVEETKKIHLVADDDWMSILDEPMCIDDDFDDDEPLVKKSNDNVDKKGVEKLNKKLPVEKSNEKPKEDNVKKLEKREIEQNKKTTTEITKSQEKSKDNSQKKKEKTQKDSSSSSKQLVEKLDDKIIEKPAEKLIEKSVDKEIKKPIEKEIKKSTEKLIEKPVDKEIKKPVEKIIEKPAEKLIEKSVDKEIKKPAEKINKKQSEKEMKKLDEKISEKSSEKLIEKPVDKEIIKPAEKIIEKEIKKPDEKKIEKPVVKEMKKSAEKINKKQLEKEIKKPDEKPVEKEMKKTTEKLIEQPVEEEIKNEDKKIIEKPIVKEAKKIDEKIINKPVEKENKNSKEVPTDNSKKQDEKLVKTGPIEKPKQEPSKKTGKKDKKSAAPNAKSSTPATVSVTTEQTEQVACTRTSPTSSEADSLNPGNKSYAQVAKSRSPSPQEEEEEIVICKPKPIKQSQDKNKQKTSSASSRINKKEKSNVDKKSDKSIDEVDFVPSKNSAPVIIEDSGKLDPEEISWATVAAKKLSETLEPVVKTIDKKPPAHPGSINNVQIIVKEVSHPEPIENVVQVDEQGFIEYVNRRELRSRRSRSRSRSVRRDVQIPSQTTDTSNDKNPQDKIQKNVQIKNEPVEIATDNEKEKQQQNSNTKKEQETPVDVSKPDKTKQDKKKKKQKDNKKPEQEKIITEIKLDENVKPEIKEIPKDTNVTGKNNNKNNNNKSTKPKAEIKIENIENPTEAGTSTEKKTDESKVEVKDTSKEKITQDKKKNKKDNNKKIDNDKVPVVIKDEKVTEKIDIKKEDVETKPIELVKEKSQAKNKSKNDKSKKNQNTPIVDDKQKIESVKNQKLISKKEEPIVASEESKIKPKDQVKVKKIITEPIVKVDIEQQKQAESDKVIPVEVKKSQSIIETKPESTANKFKVERVEQDTKIDEPATPEDLKDAEFCVIRFDSNSITQQEPTQDCPLLQDMVIIPPVSPEKIKSEELPVSEQRPLPKAKASSDLSAQSDNSPVEICDTSTSKVQFYIDEDDIVVVSHTTNPEELDNEEDSCHFMSLDDFWTDKNSYHNAEREYFENISSKNKEKVEKLNKSYSHDDNNDNSGGGGGGGSNNNGGGGGSNDPSTNQSRDLSSAPHTERLVGDLPGGMCSWNDYSTYLSLEKKYQPVNINSISNLDNYNNTIIDKSSTSLLTQSFDNTHPQSKQDLGHENTEDQMNTTLERKMTINEDFGNRYKEFLGNDIDKLRQSVNKLEESLNSIPEDSIDTMLTAITTILKSLRKFDKQATNLNEKITKISPNEQRLSSSLDGIRVRITELIGQSEQGKSALKMAKEIYQKRENEIMTYQKFLEETDVWLQNLISSINQQHTIESYKALQEDLSRRTIKVSELESLPEVNGLAGKLKDALIETTLRIKQKQQELEEQVLSSETTDDLQDDMTLDQAPSIHSNDGDSLSWADVSLQTGQSLITDKKPVQLTKSTSMIIQESPITISHSIPIQTSTMEPSTSQETINIRKSTNDTHDVIEISTKNIPSSKLTQTFIDNEKKLSYSDDIVVDMNYKDAKFQENSMSELNIQHAAPQSFETILVEPDDITTEIVVDADGTKRIIVKKLRKTLMTSSQITQHHQSLVSTVAGDDDLPVLQAFSEATLKGQQVTVTRTRPDGSLETTTKQSYGGKVITGTSDDNLHVEEFNSDPQYSHQVIQGELSLEPETLEQNNELTIQEGGYTSQTSTVHAMVQQVTRRVIKRTRKIIRKITIIDGKETVTEEIVEEPEEIEIDDENIPHISINVLRQQEQQKKLDDTQTSKEPISPLQGPFFGADARELTPESFNEELPIQEENKNDNDEVALTPDDVIDGLREDEQIEPTTSQTDVLDTKDICKSVDAPVKKETPDIFVESGTLVVEQHTDYTGTLESAINKAKMTPVVLEKQQRIFDDTRTDDEDIKSISTTKKIGQVSLMSLEENQTVEASQSTSNVSQDLQLIQGLEEESKNIIEKNLDKEIKPINEKIEISLSIQDLNKEKISSVGVDIISERTDDICKIVKESIDIELPATSTIVEEIPKKIETIDLSDKSDSETTSSRKHKKKKKRKNSEASPGTSVTTTIAESTEINLPQSDSLKQLSEQPQADVLEITEASLSLSSPHEEIQETGYEPDDRTTVDDEVSLTQDDIELSKKKKKKKKTKKSKIEGVTDDIVHDDSSENLISNRNDDKLMKNKKELNEIETQTILETRDVSAGAVEPDELKIEKEINQPEKKNREKDIDTEVQTSPTPVLHLAVQTIDIISPEKDVCSVQTMTPEKTPREEESIQTSPIEIMTIKETDIIGTQTSPIDDKVIDTTEIETQTIKIIETTQDAEQQTSPEPQIEKIIHEEIGMQTITPDIIEKTEIEIQTSKPTTPEAPKIDNTEVQTDIIDNINVETMETQTDPDEIITRVSTEEIEIQTNSPEPMIEAVAQTTPIQQDVLLNNNKITTEQEVQTISPIIKETLDENVQSIQEELIPTHEESVQIIPDTIEHSQQTLELTDQKIDDIEIIEMTNSDNEKINLNKTVEEIITPLTEDNVKLENEKLLKSEMEKKSMIPSFTEQEYDDDDTSLEIHVHATFELSDSVTTDSSIIPSESIDSSYDSTLTQEIHEPTTSSSIKSRKHSKKKNNKKLFDNKKNILPQSNDFVYDKSIDSRDSLVKLSYSDVARKNTQPLLGNENDNAVVERADSDMKVTKFEEYKKDDKHEQQQVGLKVTFEENERRENLKIQETLVAAGSSDETEVHVSVEIKDYNKQPELVIKKNPEPVDTLNEPLSNIENKTGKLVEKIGLTKLMSDRLKNLENSNKTNSLFNILHLSMLENISSLNSNDNRIDDIKKELNCLKNAVEQQNITAIEETLITIVENITTWLETIEYKIFVSKDSSSGPSYQDSLTLVNVKNEILNINNSIQELDDICQNVETIYPEDDQERIRECMKALEYQVKTIENIVIEEENITNIELTKWNEFLNEINTIVRLVQEQKSYFEIIIQNESSTIWKIEELEKIESTNRCHVWKINNLLEISKYILLDYPGKKIPDDIYNSYDITQTIEHNINIEREKLLQLLSLAEEYEQTLKEFEQITWIADDLLSNPISIVSLEHLQEEIQKHRKFFVNLSHCQAILESLEDNLDPETKIKYSNLHEKLHEKSSTLLDSAAARSQQMSLAASRWMTLEQSIKEERGWLQVAHQRIPDLESVTSSDYNQYISLYQILSSDISTHHDRLIQLLNISNGLQELIKIEDSEDCYTEALDAILILQDNVDSSLRYLLSFKDYWCTREILVNRIDNWMARAERELGSVQNHWQGQMRQFWELKAQYEVHNNMRNEANICFEQSLRIIPLCDEMLQRQYQGELEERWHGISNKIKTIQKLAIDTLSCENIPVNEKLELLECELNELRKTIDSFHGVLKTEDELELYVERLTIMYERVSIIENELGRLGMLPLAESERVGILLSLGRRIECQINEELDLSKLLRERLQILQRGLKKINKSHDKEKLILDQCENAEKQSSDIVSGAVDKCQQVSDELSIIWKDIMGLRQLLHTLPGGMRVSVSPIGIERDISSLQDVHTDLESRCTRILSILKNRLLLWRRFERQLELVQQSVQEADYMMELLTVQGSVDYDRLLKATERLEGLNGSLGAQEVLVDELREAAEPLRESCTPEVGKIVDAAVNEAVKAWQNTRAELDELCTKYQHAVRLWENYRDSSAAVKAWVDLQMGSVTNLPPEEACKQVKVCEETLAEHKERLAKLRCLVSQIASDVGLDAGGPLQCEVEALGRRLEDVRETLSTLADTADARALNQELTRGGLHQTKNFLDSVQQSLSTVGQGESKEQLKLLRNHLLALTKTEPQLQSIKERSIEIITEDTTVVEVLQLWQRVFRDTFQQYHRLSTRLVRSEDVSAALHLWHEYLINVQEFLSNDVPGDYNGLSEHRNICEVHKNLLTDQQHLILSIRAEKGRDLLVAEKFNELTNIHNETLLKIMDRHGSVRNRLDLWDKYRKDQNKLLTWLKDIERERSRLQLRFIHLRRLDKIINKIDMLLDKLPIGEIQIDSLSQQQKILLADCEEALAISIRMEHAANTQRITNLRASLETWKKFVFRIKNLNIKHIETMNEITNIFTEISQTFNSTYNTNINDTIQHAKQKLDSLQYYKTKLMNSTSILEQLDITTEQLRECLSPSDMKNLNQQCSLLWQQHGDLEHQLALLNYKLSERLGLKNKWDNRYSRFLIWLTDAETRIHSCDSGHEEPEEALRRLEGELHAEMALKQRELNWIKTIGNDLIEFVDIDDKKLIESSLYEINERWIKLMNTGKARANKLIDIMQTMSSLEKRIAEIRSWLGKIELQLTEPFIIEKKSQNIIDKKIVDHETLQKTIEEESGNIGEVLNLCEILLGDCDAWKTSFNTETIRAGMNGLEKRWKSTCVRSADRKRKIMTAWKLIQELDNVKNDQEVWINNIEKELNLLEDTLDKISKEDTEQTINKTRRLLKDIDAHRPAQQILEQSYSRLAKGGIEPSNLKSLTCDVRKLLEKWHSLKPRANGIITSLQKEQKVYRDFITAHGSAVVSLTQIDVKLTQVQHLSTPEQQASPRKRLKEINNIEKELETQSQTLQRADELALIVMQDCHSDDIPAVQELVDEYQLLWQDIKTRVTNLKLQFEKTNEKIEVDEAIQVETLKFEQDCAVQVDTLPRLIKMTSCDAYLIELESALNECRGALCDLENIIANEPIAGPGISNSAKNLAKLIGSCQSSIELARHLHGILLQDDRFNNDTVKNNEVDQLVLRYEELITRARAREQQIKEIRSPIVEAYSIPCEHDDGRLTCPLCSRRNWAQLDIDLWRLEKWLDYAEATQSEQQTPPSAIEDLEDIVQDHREFLLDLDSHKSIVVSLNIVGTHLAAHTEDTDRANDLKNRSEILNNRWERVLNATGIWQNLLQAALIGNQDFHRIVDELLNWLEMTEESIRASEPIDLTENSNILRLKYEKFRELRSDLERCEPRVLSLQEVANQLLDEHADSRNRVQELRLRLQSLCRLTGIYALKLGASLGLDPKEVGLAATTSSLASLSQDLLDEAASAASKSDLTSMADGDENDRTVLLRGYRFIGRVLRASLPIQALMLVLLGVASLVPNAEEDYSCMLSNNFARTFSPIVDYPNGPPPL